MLNITLLVQPVIGEKQIDKALDHGLNDPFTRSWIVLAALIFVAAAVWAFIILPAQIKSRSTDRDDRKLEREFRERELAAKNTLELSRAAQAVSIEAAARSLERTIPHAQAILNLAHEQVQRNCPGIVVPPPIPKGPHT